MGYMDIELAKIHIQESLKMGLESQRVHRELSEGKIKIRVNRGAIIREKFFTVRCYFLQFVNYIYCRTLSFIHS